MFHLTSHPCSLTGSLLQVPDAPVEADINPNKLRFSWRDLARISVDSSVNRSLERMTGYAACCCLLPAASITSAHHEAGSLTWRWLAVFLSARAARRSRLPPPPSAIPNTSWSQRSAPVPANPGLLGPIGQPRAGQNRWTARARASKRTQRWTRSRALMRRLCAVRSDGTAKLASTIQPWCL